MRTVANRVEEPTWHLLPEMSQQQQCNRENLVELKALIVKKIGPERTFKYFEQFRKYIEGKLVKIKFDELCCLTIGKENIGLHNHLIKSVLKNALLNKTPSNGPMNGVLRKPTPNSPLLENGDFLCSSNGAGHASFGGGHRRIRSDRRTRYSLSVNSPRIDDSGARLQGVVARNEKTLENLKPPDFSRPLPLSPAPVRSPRLPEAEFKPSGKRQLPEAEFNRRVKRQQLEVIASSTEQVLEDDKVANEVADVEDEKLVAVGEVNEQQPAVWMNRPVTAPLGISFCPGTVASARRPTYTRLNYDSTYCLDAHELPDTETVCRKMEWVAKAEGLQNVSLECANTLNHGADAFLKRLIKSVIDLKKGSSGCESQAPYRQIPSWYTQDVNSSRAGHPLHMHSTSIAKDAVQKESCDQSSISLLDLKTAMELSPQQLGEDWPLKLEEIYFRLLNQE